MLGPFAIAFVLYCGSSALMYSSSFKFVSWQTAGYLALAIVCNLLWMYIASSSASKHALYLNGMLWDAMIVLTYCLIPVLFFEVRFTTTNAIGVALIIGGMFVTKL